MHPTEEQYALIEQYIMGNIKGDNLKMIETLIQNDPIFADAVHTERLIYAAIRKAKKAELKSKLKQATGALHTADLKTQGYTQFSISPPIKAFIPNASAIEPKQPAPRPAFTQRSFMRYAGVAAVLVMAVGIILLAISRQNTHTTIPPEETEIAYQQPKATIENDIVTNKKSEKFNQTKEETQNAILSHIPDFSKVVPIVAKQAPAGLALPDAVKSEDLPETTAITVAVTHVETEEPMYQLGEKTLLIAAPEDFLQDDFDLVRLSNQNRKKLYLENGTDFYPLVKSSTLTALKPETNKEIINLLSR